MASRPTRLTRRRFIANGRIERTNAAPNRNVHVLTRELANAGARST